jgi:hypothetical protein
VSGSRFRNLGPPIPRQVEVRAAPFDLLQDDQGHLTLGRLRPGHRVLAGCLAAPGPVPARGVAMVSQLLADGTGPLYREASADDLGGLIGKATRALTR